MTIHRIRLLGDPVLRARCEPITQPGSAAVRMIVDDLRDTLRDWQSRFGTGRGIAAPQIGAPVRIIYLEMDRPWPLINPEIIWMNEERVKGEEGCLSVPGIYDGVERATAVKVVALDRSGQHRTIEAEGMLAVCIQHELDHLMGKVFVEYLSPLKQGRIKTKMVKAQKAER